MDYKEKFKEDFFDICFDAYWKNNLDIADKKNIDFILETIEFNKKNFFDGIEKLEIKNELKELTNKAFDKDIFGAPTFVVNNKIFWGQDRLDYALEEFNS